MRVMPLYLLLIALAIAGVAQTAAPNQAAAPGPQSARAVLMNQSEANWKHPASEAAGVENAAIREDQTTGAFDVLARYPAGHVISPHWHLANERMLVVEGRMQVEVGGKPRFVDAGGFAFLPAREIQKLSCVSKTRCSLYLSWDGRFDSHRVLAP